MSEQPCQNCGGTRMAEYFCERGQRFEQRRCHVCRDAAPSALQVWYGPMPESNGKSNFTAVLHKGDLVDGHTIARSEYPDRVRYEADRVRFLLGELPESPDILAYDADKHSGYIYPDTTCGVVCQAAKDDGVCCAEDECDRENGVRPAAPPVRSAATTIEAAEREPTGHVFECPDCGKDCADDTEPHAADCERRSTAMTEPVARAAAIEECASYIDEVATFYPSDGGNRSLLVTMAKEIRSLVSVPAKPAAAPDQGVREALLPVEIIEASDEHNGGSIKLSSGRVILLSKADAAALSRPAPDAAGSEITERIEKIESAQKWPSGCRSGNSCDRHKQCMYKGCRYEGQDITRDIAAAKAALLPRQERGSHE